MARPSLRTALAGVALDPRGPVRSTVLAVGTVAVVAAFAVGFWSGAWWQHGRSPELPPRETATPTEVRVEGSATAEAVEVSPTARPDPDTPTPYPQPTPWPEPTPEVIYKTIYVECLVVGVSAVLTSGEQQTEAARSGVLLCPG